MSVPNKLAQLARATAFQWWPAAAVRRYQLIRLRRMLRLCGREVPFYRERFAAHGVRASDLRSLEDLARFPVVTREEVVEAYPDRLCPRPPGPTDHVFRTSGTSGLFMEIAYSAAAYDRLDAGYARALFATGYRPWHRIAYFWWEEEPRPLRLYERLGLMRKHLLPLDPDPAVQLAHLRRVRPRYVYNFPSTMGQIAHLVAREGRGDLAPEGIICHGELLVDEVRDRIGAAFGCPVWNQYGAQEFNRIGWDCERHGPFHMDADSLIVEVLVGDRPARPGEEGELVITGLVNELMPLIRYRTGDLGRLVPGACPCGRGLPLFEVTEGRIDDLLRLPDGREIGPRVVASQIERLEGFTQYRVVQRARDRFEVCLVGGGRDPAVEVEVVGRLEAILGERARIAVSWVDQLPLGRRGKLRKIVSELPAEERARP